MNAPTPTPSIDAACRNAMARLRDFISRSAGQHRRAIARSFAEIKTRQEPQEGAPQ